MKKNYSLLLLLLVSQLGFSQLDTSYFKKIKTKKIASNPSVEWKNFGPGMSGYCEEFWCHPTDPNVMFMGPDMHVSYGTWDGGKSWQTIKDSDGLGIEMKRVLDIEFSMQNPNFGMALDWNGWIYETKNKGRKWTKTGTFGKNYQDEGVKDPNDVSAFSKGWYYEQLGSRHSELAVDPTNDNVWYVGSGDFWNMKKNHRSQKQPNGVTLKYAAYGVVWKTEDKGAHWIKITNGIPENTEVGKIIINPNNPNQLIMATNIGVLLSNDGGLSWDKNIKGLANNLPRDLTYYYNKTTKEFVLYLVDQTVYKAQNNTTTAKGGVFKSLDAGKTWQNITNDLVFNLSALNYPAEADRYYKTIGFWFGTSKKDIKKQLVELPNKTLPVFNRIVVNPLNAKEIYVSYAKKHDFTFGPGDVWKTEDGGKHWTVCVRHGSYWKSGNDDGFWKQRNNAVGTNLQFSHMQKYMDEEPEISGNRMMAINAKGQVFIGIDQQTLITKDNGKTWQQIDDDETSVGSKKWIGRGDSNLPGRFMLHETGIKGRRLLCSGEHGLWQTTTLDGWKDKQAVVVEQIEGQNNTDGAHSISTVAVHPNNPDIIFTYSWRQEHRGKLRKSIDGGKTWKNIVTLFESDTYSWKNTAYIYSLIIDPVNPNNMYFCTVLEPIAEISGKATKLTKGEYGFYKSTDGGYTWKVSNKGLPKKGAIRRIAMDPKNPKIIYAALNDKKGGLYISKNQGEKWKSVSIPKEIKSVTNVFIDRNNEYLYITAGRRSSTYAEGGVWLSKNKGKTWNKIFKAPFVWQVETSPLDPNMIMVSVAGQKNKKTETFMNPGLYLSKDGGKTWDKINKGLGQQDKVVDIKLDPYNKDVIWCATWGSGWYVAYLNNSKQGWLK